MPLNCVYQQGFSAWDALLAVTLIPIATFVIVCMALGLFGCVRAIKSAHGSGKSNDSGDGGGDGGDGGGGSGGDGGGSSVIISKTLGLFMTAILLVLPTLSRRI